MTALGPIVTDGTGLRCERCGCVLPPMPRGWCVLALMRLALAKHERCGVA